MLDRVQPTWRQSTTHTCINNKIYLNFYSVKFHWEEMSEAAIYRRYETFGIIPRRIYQDALISIYVRQKTL